MRKYVFFLGLWLSLAIPVFSQALQISANSLNFGTTTELSPLAQFVTVKNTGLSPVHIQEFRTYPHWGSYPFTCATDSLTIAPGDSARLEVGFLPRQNMAHNSELILLTADGDAIAIDLRGQGCFSNAYYAPTENLSQEPLKAALKARLGQGYVSLSYHAARDQMFMFFDNLKLNGGGATVNTLPCIYTGRIVSNYANRTEAQLMGFNTEHVYPQSFFNQQLPERSDLFHLYPTWEPANSARGNLPFGSVAGNGIWQDGGSKSSGAVFEPRDEAKGKIARCMLYFGTRYGNYGGFLTQQETILRQWALAFPPDTIDQLRNEAIFALQNNRNPFIDYPQLLHRIASLSGSATESARYSMDLPTDTLRFGEINEGDTAVKVWVGVNTGNRALALTTWGVTTSELAIDAPDTVFVAPGDAFRLPVRLCLSDSGAFFARIQWRSQKANGQFGNFELPITATGRRVSLSVQPHSEASGWRFWVAGRLLAGVRSSAAPAAVRLRMLDGAGKCVWSIAAPGGVTFWEQSLPDLPAGAYPIWWEQGFFRFLMAD